jgi:hypothetical protein
MSLTRPTSQEIRSKIDEALAAISLGKCQLGLTHFLARDLEECFIYDEDDFWSKLPCFLEEIKRADPVTCYAGKYPPTPSNQPALDGLELWEYHWNSDSLNGRFYLKFCVKAGRDGKPNYLHVRIHPDRPFED